MAASNSPLREAHEPRRTAGAATRFALVLLLCVAVFLALSAVRVWWASDNGIPIGTTVPANLDWDCAEHIRWRDPDGHQWWAGQYPHLTIAATYTGFNGHAQGKMTFTSRTTARFTDQTGGTLELTLIPKDQSFLSSCILTLN